MHVLVPAGCTRPLVGGTCASSTPAMAQPQKRIPATSSLLCNSKRQGGGFGGAQIALMYPGRRFLVELATPGGLRSPKTSIIQSACNCFYTTIPLPPPFLRLKPGKFGNKTGAVPSPLCPNFRRLDQSMQITAATAIAFAFETAKDCWGIVPSSDYLFSE